MQVHQIDTTTNDFKREKAKEPKKPKIWKNLYYDFNMESFCSGHFDFNSKKAAEEAANQRAFPEMTEYLGAFPICL